MPLREEFITKAILRYLDSKGWRILAFDYPQSGTGIPLHPTKGPNCAKNLGAITPDIVASKDQTLLILENKPGFYKGDVQKLKAVKAGEYSESIRMVFGISDFSIKVGIGIGDSLRDREKALLCTGILAVILWVDKKGNAHQAYSSFEL